MMFSYHVTTFSARNTTASLIINNAYNSSHSNPPVSSQRNSRQRRNRTPKRNNNSRQNGNLGYEIRIVQHGIHNALNRANRLGRRRSKVIKAVVKKLLLAHRIPHIQAGLAILRVARDVRVQHGLPVLGRRDRLVDVHVDVVALGALGPRVADVGFGDVQLEVEPGFGAPEEACRALQESRKGGVVGEGGVGGGVARVELDEVGPGFGLGEVEVALLLFELPGSFWGAAGGGGSVGKRYNAAEGEEGKDVCELHLVQESA